MFHAYGDEWISFEIDTGDNFYSRIEKYCHSDDFDGKDRVATFEKELFSQLE